MDCSMRIYASSITEEQRIASGAASLAGTDREGFDEVKGLQDLHLLWARRERATAYSLGYSVHHYPTVWKHTQMECVPPLIRGVIGHKIGLGHGQELRPLGHEHAYPLSSPSLLHWQVCRDEGERMAITVQKP